MRNKKVVAMFAGHYHRNVCTWPYSKVKNSTSASGGVVVGGEGDEKKIKSESVTDTNTDTNSDSSDDEDDYKVDEDDVINPMNVSVYSVCNVYSV